MYSVGYKVNIFFSQSPFFTGFFVIIHDKKLTSAMPLLCLISEKSPLLGEQRALMIFC